MSEQFQDCLQVYKMYSQADFNSIKDLEPFEKLENMLEDWREELTNKTMTHNQINSYATEFWETAKEFEEALKQDYYKFDMEREYIQIKHDNQMRQLRHKTHIRIEALEAALNEVKIDKNIQVEQALMA